MKRYFYYLLLTEFMHMAMKKKLQNFKTIIYPKLKRERQERERNRKEVNNEREISGDRLDNQADELELKGD
ncbi:MAG: hypothetical protein WC312_03700 [Candidatus Omnitrophota bacterium]